MKLIQEKAAAINSLCEKHKVEQLYAFGSVLTSSFNSESDVDFLVNFKKSEIQDFASNYFELKFAFEDLLGRDVDLIESEAIKNPYFKDEVDDHKMLIYGK